MPDKEYDIYRDSLLRYCGYANEVGEAFRAQTAHMKFKGYNWPVSITYIVATTYCAADSLDKCKIYVRSSFYMIIINLYELLFM